MKPHVTKLVKLKLVGLDGNALSVLGEFRRAATKQGIPQNEIDAVLKDAMSGDYNHLLATILTNITN